MLSKISILILLLLLISSSKSSEWYQAWPLDEHDIAETVCTIEEYTMWVGANNFDGDTCKIYRLTMAGGFVKLPVIGFMTSSRLTCLSALDSMRAWVGTTDGKIYRTTNGGQNWVMQLDAGTGGYINDIRFSQINPNWGYANSDAPGGLGSPFIIFKTTNAGENWTKFTTQSGIQYYGAAKTGCITDSAHYWMGLSCQFSGCQVPSILRTTNGGINWIQSSIPNQSNFVSAITFKSDNLTGMTTPWDVLPVNIYKSTNGGSSWGSFYTTSFDQPIGEVDWAEGTSTWYFYSSEESAPIHRSTNDGQSWIAMETANSNDQVICMDIKRFEDYVFGYAVTVQGYVLQLMYDSVSVIGVTPISNEIPKFYSLSQNYPNPFNPVTKIKFDIPKSSFTYIKIFDALGREIASIVNEELKSGKYEVTWNAASYPSGVYFYKLIAEGFSETKKMILIK